MARGEVEWLEDISGRSYSELVGHTLGDPVLEAVELMEGMERQGIEYEDGLFVGIQLMDWDAFAAACEAYHAEHRKSKRPENGGRFVAVRLSDKTCAHCGTVFHPRNADRVYCPHACYSAAQTKHRIRPCASCGKPFKPQRASVRCCSRKCSNALRKNGTP